MNSTPILASAADPRHRPEAIAERILPAELRRGRGAATNVSGRYEVQKREDFDTRLFAKERAAELLERELASPKYKPAPIAFGANTDPYQPIERQYRITRSLIETLAQASHPLTIVTKSNLILRDRDLLAPMARDGLVKVFVSVTTLDRALAREMEPRAPTPEKRLEAIEKLNDAGVPAGVMAAPVIPAINDEELETI